MTEQSNAELLRRAAKQMRTLADVASMPENRRPYGDRNIPSVLLSQWPSLVENYLGGPIGEHCASWTPAVALAVADWLDGTADIAESEDRVSRKWPEGSYVSMIPALRTAVAVARAYLGETS